MTNTNTAAAADKYPADAIRLAKKHDLDPEVADRVLYVANEAIGTKLAQTLDSLAFEIEGELDEADQPNSAPIAEDAAHLLGYGIDGIDN